MRTSAVLFIALMLAACASPQPAGDVSAALQNAQVLLLGEVHDNADGHRQRFALLETRVAAGWRPVIAMEQFDIEQQAELDEAMRSCADAACVVKRVGGTNWQWSFYQPVIALALQHHLPLLAANLSRGDASRVIRGGFAAVFDADTRTRLRLDQALPADIANVQAAEIIAGHCNKLPGNMVGGMVNAQTARDITMARVIAPHANGRGVVLMAGNGHVRKDVGVTRWLTDVPPDRVLSIGFVEQPVSPADAFRYDSVRGIAPQQRDDPCVGI